MPLEIAFVASGDAEGQAIGDLSRDFLGKAGCWTTAKMSLAGFFERAAGDAAELDCPDFNARATDFNGVHFKPSKKKAA